MEARPRSARARHEAAQARALLEIEAAVRLVASGAAKSVRVAGLPGAERVAADGAVLAQRAGIAYRLERPAHGRTVVRVGPVIDDPSRR